MTSAYLWIKSLHVIAVVCWFAGLFYLPRLFVYHCGASDPVSHDRFVVMEDKLYRLIMRPSMIASVLFGVIMLALRPGLLGEAWLWCKLAAVLALLGYHHYCGRLLKAFASGSNRHSERFLRMFNEAPALLLIVIVILVIVKPF